MIQAVAENLPFQDATFDIALKLFTICFLQDVKAAFKEAHRILQENGHLVVALVPRDSPFGEVYVELQEKNADPFYKKARFYTSEEVYHLLEESNFKVIKTVSSLIKSTLDKPVKETPVDGHDKNASFIAILAQKTRN